MNEALRTWVAKAEHFYIIGTVVGPHPIPPWCVISNR